MQIALVSLLVGVLIAAVGSFVIMGYLQFRRRVALARKAHEIGMRFSGDDPYDVPRRYAGFELISSGHSPHADNVTSGHIAGWSMRAFDFRYEVGHGTRRMARHYNVVVVETDLAAPPVLMWHERDRQCAPLVMSRSNGRVRCWDYLGSRRLVEALAGACGRPAERDAGVQIRGGVLMLFEPVRRRRHDYTSNFADAVAVAGRLASAVGPGASSDRHNLARPGR